MILKILKAFFTSKWGAPETNVKIYKKCSPSELYRRSMGLEMSDLEVLCRNWIMEHNYIWGHTSWEALISEVRNKGLLTLENQDEIDEFGLYLENLRNKMQLCKKA